MSKRKTKLPKHMQMYSAPKYYQSLVLIVVNTKIKRGWYVSRATIQQEVKELSHNHGGWDITIPRNKENIGNRVIL